MNKAPVKLIPAFKDYLWGGKLLKERYNKECSLNKVAESWELSTHPDGESIIAEGEFKGLKLSEYIEKNEGCTGERADRFGYFPILIKFIDAYDNLSIQVHPDDEYALRVEGEFGKTEMWYIAECEEGASLYYGVNREITKEEFRERIYNNTVLEVLNCVSVKKGDVLFIPAGTIHAIGKGIVIYEIQQNSNTTYRVYDYDRRDKNGNTRELHIEKALQVTNLFPSKSFKVNAEDKNLLANCKYFTVYRYDINGQLDIEIDIGSFRSVTVIEGSNNLVLDDIMLSLKKGDTVYVPAQDGVLRFTGNGSIIVAHI